MSDSSDTSDEEYIPSDRENVSEEECSGDEEDFIQTTKNDKKTKELFRPPRRAGGIQLEDDEVESAKTTDEYNERLKEEIEREKAEKKALEEKKRVEDLWSSFKADVGIKRPQVPESSVVKSEPVKSPNEDITEAAGEPKKTSAAEAPPVIEKKQRSNAEGKVCITKEYDFAGEVIKVTKEVDVNSKEARQQKTEKTEEKKTQPAALALGAKRRGGLGAVLGQIGKKPKMSTLDKSKMDWNTFKSAEGLTEELDQHNRSKHGYLERQAFLQRADLRQFEIERDLRLTKR